MNSPCPDKERCGSCGWSHIPYEKQLQQKLSDINGSFKIKGLDLEVQEIVPSPKTEHYRNRMDFVIDFEGRVGMREKGKWWKVIDGHHCFLADEQIEKLFTEVRDWTKTAGLSFYDRKAHTGFLRYAVIRSTTLGETMLILVTSTPEGDEKKVLEAFSESSSASSMIWSVNSTITDVSYGDKLETISGPGYIEEEINGLRYRITPNAFFQTNPHGGAALMDAVTEFAGDVSEKTVLDLYCGSGFFTIPLASSPGLGEVPEGRRGISKVVGVELVPDAIADAIVNAELNSVDAEFHVAKTEEFAWWEFSPDLVILDPPRCGMHDKALAQVLEHSPDEIVYVSCNYKNFAREMVKLQDIYEVVAMRAIDMFPHTPHVELVAHLKKR